MSLTAKELLEAFGLGFQRANLDATHDDPEWGASIAGLAAVLGRISQWARALEADMREAASREQPFTDTASYCDGKQIAFAHVAMKLDVLRSALMGEKGQP